MHVVRVMWCINLDLIVNCRFYCDNLEIINERHKYINIYRFCPYCSLVYKFERLKPVSNLAEPPSCTSTKSTRARARGWSVAFHPQGGFKTGKRMGL